MIREKKWRGPGDIQIWWISEPNFDVRARITAHPQISGFPLQINEFPSQINEFPSQINEFPSQINGFPSQINEFH